MLNRWIARACIGLMLLGGGLFATPSWAVNEHTPQAVQGYLNVTLPAIARMKPYIDKSERDRAKAFAAMGITDTTCDASMTEAIKSGEHYAEGAANLCQALIAWMQNEDIFTCSRVNFSGIDFAHTEPVDEAIAKRHKADDILSTRLRLQKAAGCATKTVAYWGPRTLGLYDLLAASVSNTGELLAPTSGGAAPTQKAFDNSFFLCHLAYNGDQKTKSGVVDAADDGCYAMNHLRDKKVVEACKALDGAINKASSMGSSDPLAREAKGLSSKLATRFGSLGCGTVIATANVAENEARARQQAAATPPPAPRAAAAPASDPYAKRNAIINAINGEQQALSNNYVVARRWFDRGDNKEACGYYQKAMAGWRSLETLYSDLNRETGDSEYTAKSREMKGEQNKLLENNGAMCQEAGQRLY